MTKKSEAVSGDSGHSVPVLIIGSVAVIYLLGAVMLSAIFLLGLCLVGVIYSSASS